MHVAETSSMSFLQQKRVVPFVLFGYVAYHVNPKGFVADPSIRDNQPADLLINQRAQ